MTEGTWTDGECNLDEFWKTEGSRHHVTLNDYKLLVTEEVRREYCKSCGDQSCWSYKELFGSNK